MRKNAIQRKIQSAGVRLKGLALCGFLVAGTVGNSQETDPILSDTTFYDYDEIFSELDALLDSLYTPRSFLVASVSAGNGFFQYASTAANTKVASRQQLVVSPSLGFFHKSGLGINAGASLIHDSSRLKPFQFSLTGTYDYLRSMKFITGVSYTRFFTKDDLSFYTSPLQNEVYGYFTYRDHWLKPSVAASYGWGSRKDVQEQTTLIREIVEKATNGRGSGLGNGNSGNGNGNSSGNGNGNNSGNPENGGVEIIEGSETTRTTTYESISDFSLMLSVRHDFYFLKLLSKKDYVRLTPQLSFTGGTQQFGFNALSTSSLTMSNRSKNINVVTSQQDIGLEDRLKFQPLSLTALLRTEYATGKFFIQPQFYLDYYFPAPEKNLTASFLINAGFIF
ncbi:hypothetical protein HRH25_11340 [Flavisolibacter sp. BT320]|nr:hypothetical protein [Flavisolibacter longurius]